LFFHLKKGVFRNPIDNVQELQQATATANVRPEMLANVFNQFNRRVQRCFAAFSLITYTG
jgi:hypothetical protein